MGDGNPDPAATYPYYICKSLQAPAIWTAINNLSSKGPDHEFCELETLESERNTDDGAAQHNATYQITDRRNQSAKYNPDYIANEVQGWFIDWSWICIL